MAKKQKIDWNAPVVHQEEQHPSTIPEGMTDEQYVKVLTPGTKIKVLWWDRNGNLVPDLNLPRRWTLTVKQCYKGTHGWMVNYQDGFGAAFLNRVVLA